MLGYADVKGFAIQSGTRIHLKIEDFLADISSDCGFLPKGGPLLTLDEDAFNRLVQLGEQLPELIRKDKVRETLDQMNLPQFVHEKYSYRALVRVYAVATSLVHAYILESAKVSQRKEEPVRLPQKLSTWLETLSHQIGRLPTQTYETYVLQNYRLINEKLGYTLENIEPLVTYTGTSEEKWFIKMHVFAEHSLAKAMTCVEKIRVLLTTQSINQTETHAQLINHLNAIYDVMCSLKSIYFSEMGKGLTSESFFFNLRPFLTNWKHGVVYQGSIIYKEAVCWRGASGAQSSFIPAIDLVCQFNIAQQDTMRDMVNYMPPEHQAFLDLLRNMQDGLSQRIAATRNRELIESYDKVANESHAFRRKHYTLFVQEYILKNLVTELTNNIMKSLSTEYGDLLKDYLGVECTCEMISRLMLKLFTNYKTLMLNYNMNHLLEANSRAALDEMISRLKNNLFISPPALSSDSIKTFEEAVLASFLETIQSARTDYWSKRMLDKQQINEDDNKRLTIIIEKIFDQFVELSSKSLGTGGEDFSLFLQKNISDTKNSALKNRLVFFSPKDDTSVVPANSSNYTCNEESSPSAAHITHA